MHHADIHALLIKSGINQAQIASDMKVTPTTVSLVIKGNSTSYRVASYIAHKVGKPINILWPGRYTRRQLRHAA